MSFCDKCTIVICWKYRKRFYLFTPCNFRPQYFHQLYNYITLVGTGYMVEFCTNSASCCGGHVMSLALFGTLIAFTELVFCICGSCFSVSVM